MADVKRVKQLSSLQQEQVYWQNAEETAGSTTLDPYLDRPTNSMRSPMLVSTRAWMKKNKYIILWVNPSEMSWKMPKRETVSKTAAGAIRNTWRNRFRGTYYDEPTLDITFQTGNIMPYANMKPEIFGSRSVGRNNFVDPESGIANTRFTNARQPTQSPYLTSVIQAPPVPPGIQNLYDFIALIDQPILQGWGENRHVLFYRTQVFPRLRVEGYFSPEGLSFSESVDNANRLTWTAQFQVYSTSPKFWNASDMKMAYSASLRENGFASELFPPEYRLGYDQIQADLAARSGLPKNPKDPDEALVAPTAKTGAPRLVSKDGKTAIDQKHLVNITNEETSANFKKTNEAAVKKYKLAEPLKSKFLAEMAKLESQENGAGTYASRGRTDGMAQRVLFILNVEAS